MALDTKDLHQTLSKVLSRRALKFPLKPKVIDVRWRPYVDSLGEDALEVRIVLDNDVREEDLRGAKAKLYQVVQDALFKAGIDLFPYLRISTQAELDESPG